MSKRLAMEAQLLAEYFPRFHIQSPGDPVQCGVVGMHRTNTGNEYALWIPLGNFPNEAPRMYVVSPKNLRHRSGQLLSSLGTSSAMHLLGPNEHGHPQICHYNGQYWHPKVTLHKIVMKGRLWLEAYENHLVSGRNIDEYLGHMNK